MKKDSYKLILRIVLFLYMFLNSNVIVNAQSNDNFRKLQKNSLDQIHHKRSLSKINPLQEQQELGVNDSIFKLFDVDSH